MSLEKYKTRRIKGTFEDPLTGKSKTALILLNNEGKVLHYENDEQPYTPIGEWYTFKMLIESGSITAPCFNWR